MPAATRIYHGPTLEHLRRMVLDQINYCRAPLHPSEKEKKSVYEGRRQVLFERFAGYRQLRSEMHEARA